MESRFTVPVAKTILLLHASLSIERQANMNLTKGSLVTFTSKTMLSESGLRIVFMHRLGGIGRKIFS